MLFNKQSSCEYEKEFRMKWVSAEIKRGQQCPLQADTFGSLLKLCDLSEREDILQEMVETIVI